MADFQIPDVIPASDVPRLTRRDLILMIPDGGEMKVWPVHAGIDCWCRPKCIYIDPVTGAQQWLHKSLQDGEFDA